MSFRYMTEDGEVFNTEEEAQAHNDEIKLKSGLSAEVEAYLDAEGFPPKDAVDAGARRARSRAHNDAMRWLRYDLGVHPERYEVAPKDTVVTAITGPK